MMKILSVNSVRILIYLIPAVLLYVYSCKKDDNPVKFPKGTFPDSTIILTGINSPYDDYNMDLYQLLDYVNVIFSSNRAGSGGKFDLVQGVITFRFDQTDGTFELESEITQDAFRTTLINAANTPGDDLGPYTRFSTVDGNEYLILSSESVNGDLDFYYLKNQPFFGTSIPSVSGPFPVTLLNSDANDAYICFDSNLDSAYYSSDKEGNFEIYLQTRPAETTLADWFKGVYSDGIKVDSINSSGHDKCPYILRKIMVFASDRPGGLGGFDIYYSIFREGKWSSPVNMGPDINTSHNEYRPVLGFHEDFTNNFIVFSSDRPGGKGEFDLYFRGITLPEN